MPVYTFVQLAVLNYFSSVISYSVESLWEFMFVHSADKANFCFRIEYFMLLSANHSCPRPHGNSGQKY